MCLLLSLWLLSSFAVSMGEAAKRCKIEGSLARNARFEAPTCLLLSLWVLSGFAVSMGEAAKRGKIEGSLARNAHCESIVWWSAEGVEV